MIFNLDKSKHQIDRRKSLRLSDIGWKEINFQKMMFENLDVLLPEDELLLIMQSVSWQEEPDLMAIDKHGTLFIFELKAWESQDINLLQVMRYGQIFGQYSYDELNSLFIKRYSAGKNLLETLNEKFETQLEKSDINKKQSFVLITNGLDFKTRAALDYWDSQGVSIKSWIYKIYKIGEKLLLEFETYRENPNPYEDIDEGFFILNTNIKNGGVDEKDMLENKKAAAYFHPWKLKIGNLQKGDKVFLYRSGTGIIAKGTASGTINISDYQNNPLHEDEQYSMPLKNFKVLENPIGPAEIKNMAGVNYVFMQTLFSIDRETGEKLWKKN